MPQISDVIAVGAGATVNNLVSGSIFERIGGNGARVRLYAVQIDQQAGDLRLSLLLGSDVIVDAAGLGVRAAGLQIPDDSVGDGDGLPGDQITLKAVNTDGVNPVTLAYRLDIENL